jgi:hypothetical protein
MHAIARWTEPPTLKPGPTIDLPGVDPGNLVRSLAQTFVDNRKPRRPLGYLISTTLPTDPTTRITTVKAAEAIPRAAFAGGSPEGRKA